MNTQEIERYVNRFRRKNGNPKNTGYNPFNLKPLGPTEVNVVFKAGIHYEPQIKSQHQRHSDVPHKLRDLATLPGKVRDDPNFTDLTGHRFGDFIVIGLFYCHDKFNMWVIRCVCGAYELRSTKSINKYRKSTKNDRSDAGRCLSCLDLIRLKNKDYWRIHGLYPWQNLNASVHS